LLLSEAELEAELEAGLLLSALPELDELELPQPGSIVETARTAVSINAVSFLFFI
jgi:hypothetical protein